MPTLTDSQLQSYRQNGYVIVPDAIDEAELKLIDAEMDRMLVDVDSAKTPRGWIFAPHRQESDLSMSLAKDERILSLVERVVSPGVSLHSSKLVTKMPQSDEVCHWHQDEAFYFDDSKPEMRSETRMSIWIPLQDVDEANGCLWVVPGSHGDGIDGYEMVGTGHCRRRLLRSDYANQHAVPVRVKAGDAVLFSAYLWHHSKGNTTDKLRRAFIISYQEAGIPYDAYGNPAVVLREAA